RHYATVDHFVDRFRRNRRRLAAANVPGPALDRLNAHFFSPAIHVVLDIARRLRWIFAGNAFKQQSFHLGQRRAPSEIVGVLLALVGMTVDIDGVFDFDMRRMHDAGLVLRARCIGSHTPFMSRSRNDIVSHTISSSKSMPYQRVTSDATNVSVQFESALLLTSRKIPRSARMTTPPPQRHLSYIYAYASRMNSCGCGDAKGQYFFIPRFDQ